MLFKDLFAKVIFPWKLLCLLFPQKHCNSHIKKISSGQKLHVKVFQLPSTFKIIEMCIVNRLLTYFKFTSPAPTKLSFTIFLSPNV